MKDGGEKAQEPDQVTDPPEATEVHHPVAPTGDAPEPVAATSKATAYSANFGMAVKTMDASVVQYE